MNLQEINQRLLELIKVLPPKIKELQKAEYLYARRHAALILQPESGATIVARDAYATSVCDEEGLYSPLADLRGDVKGLYSEKDLLIEMSRNLRTLRGGETIE